MMALIRREGAVESEWPEERSVLISGRIPGRLLDVFKPYEAKPERHPERPMEAQD